MVNIEEELIFLVKQGSQTQREPVTKQKVYEKPHVKPFRSVSEYFKILEAKTGVKFDHPSNSPPPSMDSNLLVRNARNRSKQRYILFTNFNLQLAC